MQAKPQRLIQRNRTIARQFGDHHRTALQGKMHDCHLSKLFKMLHNPVDAVGRLRFGQMNILWPDAQFDRTGGGCKALHHARGRQQVHGGRADEPGDKAVGGAVIQVHRRADLFDLARPHHHDPVSHGHRFDLVMGHIDHCRLRHGAFQPRDFDPRRHAQRGIKVGQRLIKQEQLGVAHQRPPDCHALALAARQNPRPAVKMLGQLQHCGGGAHLGVDQGGRGARDL